MKPQKPPTLKKSAKKLFGLTKRLQRVKRFLEKECSKRLDAFNAAVKLADEAKASQSFEQLKELLSLLKAISETTALLAQLPKEKESQHSTYVLSSQFLWDSYKRLTKLPGESLCFATGLEQDGLLIPCIRVDFDLDQQTVVYARGNFDSTTMALLEMDQFGHNLLMTMHSHPGCGSDATHPSGIDIDFHERLERGGYKAIGAIFSRDGYVRFFSHKRQFSIQIYGKGADRIEANICKLAQASNISLPKVISRQ